MTELFDIPNDTPFELDITTTPLEAVCVPAASAVMPTLDCTAIVPPAAGTKSVALPVATACNATAPAEFDMTI